MNKNIAILRDEAIEFANETQDASNNRKWDTACDEKFAELIVAECIDQMEKCFAGSIGTDDAKDVWGPSADTFKAWNGAVKFGRDAIKEHFGLK
jgi:hypothetical protein